MKPTAKLVALIVVMSALGNALGMLGIRLPSAPGTTVDFHLSALPSLLVAISFGPLAGAITGALSLVVATLQIGNVFIPLGNALLAGVAGILANKFKFPPVASGVAAMIPYSPYMWFACLLYNVPQPVIAFIIAKAFIEILISCAIIEFILLRSEVKKLLLTFKM
jgi:uncharacterized membrane protein